MIPEHRINSNTWTLLGVTPSQMTYLIIVYLYGYYKQISKGNVFFLIFGLLLYKSLYASTLKLILSLDVSELENALSVIRKCIICNPTSNCSHDMWNRLGILYYFNLSCSVWGGKKGQCWSYSLLILSKDFL